MNLYAFSLILISLANCDNATSPIKDKSAAIIPDSTGLSVAPSKITTPVEVHTAGEEIYFYRSNSLEQRLAIKHLSKFSVLFVLTTRLRFNGQQEVVSGTANAVASSNAEEDEDEEGISYPPRAYSYQKGKCSLSIHISTDPPNQMVHLYEFNCKAIHKPSLPYESGKTLRRHA